MALVFTQRRPLRGLRRLAPLALFAAVPFALLAACSSVEDGGCSKDTECATGRICDSGTCVSAPTSSTATGATTGNGATTTSGAGGATASSSSGATTGNGATSSSGATTSTGTGMGCDAGLTSCNGKCVDTNSSTENCGGCGKVCAQNETCVSAKCQANLGPGYSWVATGTKSEAVMTGSCSKSGTTTAVCDAASVGVEARVLDVDGVELKPLADLKETGAM